jgi:hypothetical protein
MLVYQVTRQYQQESLPKGLWNMNQVDLVGGISPTIHCRGVTVEMYDMLSTNMGNTNTQ